MKIVEYKKHYLIYIKWVEEPIQIWSDAWQSLQKDLLTNSNWFILINWTLYNRFEIQRVEQFEQKLTDAHLQALARQKEIEEKKKELGI